VILCSKKDTDDIFTQKGSSVRKVFNRKSLWKGGILSL